MSFSGPVVFTALPTPKVAPHGPTPTRLPARRPDRSFKQPVNQSQPTRAGIQPGGVCDGRAEARTRECATICRVGPCGRTREWTDYLSGRCPSVPGLDLQCRACTRRPQQEAVKRLRAHARKVLRWAASLDVRTLAQGSGARPDRGTSSAAVGCGFLPVSSPGRAAKRR